MVAFLHDDVGDAWLIVLLQLDAGVSDGQELVVENLHTRAFFFSTQAALVNFIDQRLKALSHHYAKVIRNNTFSHISGTKTLSYLRQLSLRNSISVENYPCRLEPGRFVELN